MKYFFCVFTGLLLTSGCGRHLHTLSVSGDCITNNPEFSPAEIPKTDNYRFIIHENVSLFLFRNGDEVIPQIENGTRLVFEYQYSKSVNPAMVDAGYTESILFEIDPELKSFVFSGSELEEVNAVYGNLCFCIDAGYHPIKNGCIVGRKTGRNEWQVDINITAYGKNREFSKMLSEKFVVTD